MLAHSSLENSIIINSYRSLSIEGHNETLSPFFYLYTFISFFLRFMYSSCCLWIVSSSFMVSSSNEMYCSSWPLSIFAVVPSSLPPFSILAFSASKLVSFDSWIHHWSCFESPDLLCLFLTTGSGETSSSIKLSLFSF